MILHDGNDGRPIGIVVASSLTAIRTAAVTAVATAHLAPKNVNKVAIIGAGVQAGAHVDAMRCVVPAHTKFVIGNRTASRAQELAEAKKCDWTGSIQEALKDADVVCTVTGSYEPILKLEWLKPGCHLNAVGSSLAELGDVLTGRHPGRTRPDDVTIFKSLGLAVEDLAAAELAIQNAERSDIGTSISW